MTVATDSKESTMALTRQEFDVFNQLEFERPPVAVKFLYDEPEGIERLDRKLPFCAMLTQAHHKDSFYVGREDHECHGTFSLGQEDIPPHYGSGAVVAEVRQVDQPRAGTEVYRNLPKLEKDTCNYVAFAQLHKMTFDPDVLVLTGNIKQAELLLRASTYTNGRLWTSKTSVVLGCAWIYVYPYITGEVNYITMGICAGGMIAFRILPEGTLIVSIPYQQLPTVIENLKTMPWDPREGMPPMPAIMTGL
jgi:uncharacterized protein (DUF169 family)